MFRVGEYDQSYRLRVVTGVTKVGWLRATWEVARVVFLGEGLGVEVVFLLEGFGVGVVFLGAALLEAAAPLLEDLLEIQLICRDL